jgi:hypothetical protein
MSKMSLCEHKVDKYPCVFVLWWVIINMIHEVGWVVTNPTIAKAMCATCFLACVVQVRSSEAVVDGEVKVK